MFGASITTLQATAGSGVDPLGLRQYKVRPTKDTISSVHNGILKSAVPCAINTVRQKAYNEVNAHPSGITLQDSIVNARVDAPGQARTAGQSTHSILQSIGGREIPTNKTVQAIQKAVKKPRAPRKPKPPKTKQPAGTNVPAINGGNAPADSVSAATSSENAVAPVKPAGKVAKKPRRPKQSKPKQDPGATKSSRTDAQAVGTASGPDVSSEDRKLLKFTSADKARVDISSRCPEKTDVDAVNGTSGELQRPRASDQPTVVKSDIVAKPQSGVGSAIGQVDKQLKRAKVVKQKDAGKTPGKVVKTKAKTKPKSVALTDIEVKAKLLEYLRLQNRPYSATDVYNNLGGTLGKTAVTKALAEMASNNAGITEKVYGKQKVYCAKQSDVATEPGLLQTLNEKLERLKIEVANQIGKKVTREKIRVELLSKPTTSQLVRDVSQLQHRKAALDDGLRRLCESTSSYTADDVLRIATDAADATAKLLERKRECNNMVDVILEGYEQKRQYLIAEIGIETDEDAGFVANR